MTDAPDLVLHHGQFTTLDRSKPDASAVAIKEGVFTSVGRDAEVTPLADPGTRVIDLKGRRVLPGCPPPPRPRSPRRRRPDIQRTVEDADQYPDGEGNDIHSHRRASN